MRHQPGSTIPVPEGTAGDLPVQEMLRRLLWDIEIAPPFTPAVHVFNTSAITVTSGSRQVLPFDSERYDTHGMHVLSGDDRTRLTCKVAGRYHIIANATFQSLNGGSATYALLFIQLNGTSTDIAVDSRAPVDAAGIGTGLSASVTYDLAVDDYIEVDAQHNYGSNRNILATGNYTPEFMMERIGPGRKG